MNLFHNKDGAIFSDGRKYRYALWRVWDELKPLVMFIGLNPSTANESTDDPTIRRVKQFAADWGFGGVYMMNLFAIVSSDPEILRTCDDPLGDNDVWLNEISIKCEKIVFAWGAFNEATGLSQQIIQRFPDAVALVLNRNGTPRHPLYVRRNVVPVIYREGRWG